MPYGKFVRAINDREREDLVKQGQMRYGSLSGSFRNLGISLGVCLCVYLLIRWLVADPLAASTVASLLGSFCLLASFATYMDGQRTSRIWKDRTAKILLNGQVKVERIEAKAVIKREESSDEGPGYFFDIGAGKTFHLVGQDVTLYDADDWPNTIFELVSAADPPDFLGIFCYGVLLEPTVTFVANSTFEEPAMGVLDRPFSDVLSDLVQQIADDTKNHRTS